MPTVADIDTTIEYYEKALGMRAITFDASKITLHQAGREFAPHAASPTPVSADLCFITKTPQGSVL